MSSPQLAFLGLGSMGMHMARNIHNYQLANGGQPLIVYNRTRTRAEKLVQENPQMQIADSLGGVAKSADIIFTCLLNDDAVIETVRALLSAGLRPGAIVVEQSTIAPETAIMLTDEVLSAGGQFISCPVVGPPLKAASAELVVLAAGSSAAREKALPCLVPAIGPKAVELGEQPVESVKLKLNCNFYVTSLIEVLAEGMTLGAAVGIGQEKVKEVLDLLFAGTLISSYADRMVRNTYRDQKHFPLSTARKDANHIIDMAASVGAKVPTVELFKEKLERVLEKSGDLDITGVVLLAGTPD
ncbi:NAD binding domain of 6-phosphogluconate dehydrogenase-domain-containing protein [Dichotomocladium elegans]|nr:NAD binding domain of 6-phosphogluconate dehydrogenase-domain-containing protein [Dichotomocladium elegans]